jgi:hypothetical protein
MAVEAHERLVQRITQEQDDVLGTLQLVGADGVLQDRLYERLVDLLIEGLFMELRQQYLDERLSRDEYVDELSDLAERCRDAGLLPLPARDV